ncbi:MAG: hypothetical protein JWO67_142 [Streptosporangiaceae bacterium]|nr:hypothetical protein [Streptosporangiaceae bacterium]
MHAELTSTRTETTRRYDLTDAPPTPVTARLVMVPLEAVVTHTDGSWSLLKFVGRVLQDSAGGVPAGTPVSTSYHAPRETPPEWARPLIEEIPQ